MKIVNEFYRMMELMVVSNEIQKRLPQLAVFFYS